MKFNWIFFLLFLSTQAQAQYVNPYGQTDYGLLQAVILGGEEVPSDRPVLRGLMAQIKVRPATADDVRDDGSLRDWVFTRNESHCSGTLIAPEVILTAGHCIPQGQLASAIQVIVAGKTAQVRSFVHHPEFKVQGRMAVFDMALIFLSKGLSQKPALLPAPQERLRAQTSALMAGFGWESNDGARSGRLKSASGVVEETRGPSLMVRGKAVTCSGDSGGPLLVQQESRYVVYGVTSSGDCASVSIFTRVSDHVDWIKEEIARFRDTRKI